MIDRDLILRLERHPLGLRLHLLGARIHEWHVGAAVLAGLAAGAASGRVHITPGAVLAGLAGAWLVVKDWHDLVPSRRDTAAWTLGLHRRPHPLRTLRRADPLPQLAAAGAVGVAFVNLVSAVTPNVGWRGHALLAVEPLAAMRLSHAIAVPAAAGLLVAALYLGRRRRRALYVAVSILLALAALNVLKGLDIEEALADVTAAALLWFGRGSFYVEHEPLTRARALRAIAAITGATFAVAGVSVWVAAPSHTAFTTIARTTVDLLAWQPAPLTFHDEVGRLGLTLGLLSACTLATAAALAFRPLRASSRLPDAATRAAAARLVRSHGSDTLAYFKLRLDKQYLFSDDGRAFIGYRVVNRVLLVSGDPVGAEASIPSLLRTMTNYAERRGLTIAALGVSARLRPLFSQLGLRSLYLGDEAVVDTTTFSLDGRAIRKVRQSVSRLEKAGYRAEVRTLADLDEATLHALRRVSEEWRAGSAERGFSMALDDVRRDVHGDSVIALARDADGTVRAFLQFVPSYGRGAMSLSFMRRERDTPNGLVEFLVVRSIELLREQDIGEISLNFAAFARIIHAPRHVGDRLAARLLAIGDRFFQIESLYRFNAKFFPRWEPRYFLFEGYARLPRAALAAARAEGQLPAFLLPRQPRSTREPPTIASRPSSNRTSAFPFPS